VELEPFAGRVGDLDGGIGSWRCTGERTET
jgi:hypothetical protein